jgi:aminopeptidase N
MKNSRMSGNMKVRLTLLKISMLALLVNNVGTILSKDPNAYNATHHSKDDYDIKFYWLDLHVSDSSTYIRGSVSILLEAIDNPLQQVVFDFSNRLITDSVIINHQLCNYIHTSNELTINLNSEVTSGSEINIQVFYHGLGKTDNKTEGIYNKYNTAWDSRITWTLSEPFFALNWFPCKQTITDKADSVYVFLSTDDSLKAGSNGILTAQVPLPGNRIRYEWKSRFPIAYYLISFAVGNYRDYSFYVKMMNDSILIQNYVFNNDLYIEQNKANIDKTADLILLFSDLFGDYPYKDEKYGHCVAPMGGGMEHQTMTTLSNFSFLLVAHELAHQWFGNLVTCSNWQNIWMNEGFASYAEYIASQYLISQSSADNWMTGEFDFVKSLPGGSVYVPEDLSDDEGRIFDRRLTYSKGAVIIHMIRKEIDNDTLFLGILAEYLKRFKYKNATAEDFKNLLEEKTGNDYDQFFNQWYYGEGYPIHSINWYDGNDTLYINSLQTTSASTPFFNVPVDYKIKVDGTDTIITLRQTSNFDSWKIYLPGNITSVEADPEHWLLIDIAGITNKYDLEKQIGFKLLPNPARKELTLYFNNNIDLYKVHVIDASGKIIYTEQSRSTRKTIDVDKYTKGLYFIIVEMNNTIYPAKFIKN